MRMRSLSLGEPLSFASTFSTPPSGTSSGFTIVCEVGNELGGTSHRPFTSTIAELTPWFVTTRTTGPHGVLVGVGEAVAVAVAVAVGLGVGVPSGEVSVGVAVGVGVPSGDVSVVVGVGVAESP